MVFRFAVMGNPIAHSLSPVIHQLFAKEMNVPLIYEKIKAEDVSFERQVSDFFAQGGKGLNITLPFKQRAYSTANHPTERCRKAGAANTLWVKENKLYADNTDGVGFIQDLYQHISIEGKRVLILGAGGAARGIIYPLLENHPFEIIIANRSLARIEELHLSFPQIKGISFSEITGRFDLLINATSARSIEEFSVLPSGLMAAKPFCYDLSYTQQGVTPFLEYANGLGCEAVDGLGMLVAQAAEAFFIWHGVMPTTHKVLEFLRANSN